MCTRGVTIPHPLGFAMWCSQCQQDVPGVVAPDSTSGICCARCGGELPSEPATSADEPQEPRVKTAEDLLLDSRVPFDLDDWELQDDLEMVQRVAKSLQASGYSGDDKSVERELSYDASHTSPAGWHVGQAPPSSRATNKQRPKKRRKRRMSFLSWTILSMGLMTFVCGGILMGWSAFTGRKELWELGLPLGLGGLAGLLIGLLFQLEGLWQSTHDTSSTLDRLDEQLNDLRHTTTLLGSTHSDPARSFYLHLSDVASPQMLLADLKGQLDLLAQQMANERRSA